MSKWVVTAKSADFNAIAEHFNIDPVVARVMRNRDLMSIEEMEGFIGGGVSMLHDPYLLPDMDKAVAMVHDAIEGNMRIRIIGDYDVDGITSTYILYKSLGEMGADVSYAIPNRITDGYGVNVSMIEDAYDSGVEMILTCDNGIAATEAIAYAKSKGMRVLVTDHHEVPFDSNHEYIYPEADCIVNPKRHDSMYPFKGICGAMVAYKLVLALCAKRPLEQDTMKELRELAGLGTVCDVMELKDENRALVKMALCDMKESSNCGIRALRQVCEIEDKNPTCQQLGFVIGPCLNATGRLDSADMSMELLSAQSMRDAVVIATELRCLNELRKSMTEQGTQEAFGYIEQNELTKAKVMVVFLPNLHESLAGIVAGRIRERYYRPTFVITETETELKGSGRSIDGYNMYEEMSKVKDVFSKFGGHAMAAGLSLPKDRLEEFVRRINEVCDVDEGIYEEKVVIDVPMPMGYVTQKLVRDLAILEPFGTGNPQPVFAEKDVILLSARRMGKTGNMAKFNMTTVKGGRFEGVMFRGVDDMLDSLKDVYGSDRVERLFEGGYPADSDIAEAVHLDVVYYPDINEFRGRESLQYIIRDYKC